MTRTLHDHQASGISRLRLSLKHGQHRRPMLQAPTGAGKTVIQSAVSKGKRVIFTVPRVSLIDQTVESFRSDGIDDIGVIQAKHPLRRPGAKVQVCSVQTLARRQIPKKADLVLIDEAHIWFKLYEEWMHAPEWAEIPFIGLSATPWTRGLGKHYDDLITIETTKGLIEKGFLSPFRAFGPKSGLKPELDGMRTVAGDWHVGQLSKEMRKPKLVADAVQTWLENGENRPTLVFAVDKAHGKLLQERFLKAGVATAYVDDETPLDKRIEIGLRLKHNMVKVVVNIECLTTGVDWDVRCIVLCRPTKSEMLYCQIIGRGLRTANGKTDLLILDHSDTTSRLGYVTDIVHDSLDDGKHHRGAHMRQKREKSDLPQECSACGFIKPANTKKCPDCGFESRKPCTVKHFDGELVELTPKGKAATREIKQSWFSQIIAIRDEKGRKPGWEAHKYRERFGVWPKGFEHVKVAPTEEVRNWVKSRDIAYAKKRQADLEREAAE
jgi:DNA repair protein RadD